MSTEHGHELDQVDVKSTALGAGIAFFTVLGIRRAMANGNGDGNDLDNGNGTENGDMNEDVSEQLETLINIQRREHGGAQSIDAYAGEMLELPPGAVATITVEPVEGHNLHVKKLYADRRDGHVYSHHVDGAEISNNHQATLRSSRRVKYGGRTVTEVTNDSGEPSSVDFEFEGWAIPSEQDSVPR